MLKFETVLSGNYELLEAPRIDDQNRLYFSEIGHFIDPKRGALYRLNAGRTLETLLLRPQIGGIVLTGNGAIVLTGYNLALWEPNCAELGDLLSSYEGVPIRRFNDLTTDSRGSIIVGSVNPMPQGGGRRPPGELYRRDAGGKVTKLWENIEFSNGLGFSPDEKLLYHCDTMTNAVWVYDVKSDRSLADRRMFAKLPEGAPDGLAVDAEGAVWVAATSTGELVRFRNDGSLERRIKVSDRMVMSLAFGGPDLCDLYVTTGIVPNTKEFTGSILKARTDVPGVPTPLACI
jgi:sugar lactone lactonase YvrE